MNRRFTHVAVGLVAVFAAAQLVRPLSANPPTDPARTCPATDRWCTAEAWPAANSL